MKEPNWKTCSEEELWKYVATHLAKNGIDTILVGGAVVAIYTEGVYRSGDLDLVLLSYRLASYIHFNALECLDQAAMVAKKFPFDRTKVKKWCKAEGSPKSFKEFEQLLKEER